MASLQGKIEEQLFYSNELQETLTLLVYYPPKFTTLVKYPILIAQDGPDYFQLGRLASIADQLMCENEMEEAIIVGVPHQRNEDRNDKYHPQGKKHDQYLRFMGLELPTFIHTTFNTYLLGSGTCLLGDSLGGYVSLASALAFPRTYGQVILQSPYVPKDLLQHVSNFKQFELLSIYHSIGDEEEQFHSPSGQIKDFLTPNRALADLLKGKQFPYCYEEFTGNHSWGDWQKNLVPALKFIFGK
ncbi:esterase [Fictibacillus macauensis ZFHKF-1]|uniref:Esterase n=1 Tax=Fictibacillus macauensis ZFHKF-1 TaxID=1196324 RepID=I8IYT6_9BACL|nr:alpha/beta hydrolase-fold protein [Fictibacillus macauensis]EIT84641.1 esterase [Fictibacillus macauensis ZFHKF-1]